MHIYIYIDRGREVKIERDKQRYRQRANEYTQMQTKNPDAQTQQTDNPHVTHKQRVTYQLNQNDNTEDKYTNTDIKTGIKKELHKTRHPTQHIEHTTHIVEYILQ